MKKLEWYLNKIKEELEACEKGGYTGNLEFKANFKDGGIANMNFGAQQSFKAPPDVH